MLLDRRLRQQTENNPTRPKNYLKRHHHLGEKLQTLHHLKILFHNLTQKQPSSSKEVQYVSCCIFYFSFFYLLFPNVNVDVRHDFPFTTITKTYRANSRLRSEFSSYVWGIPWRKFVQRTPCTPNTNLCTR